MQIGRGKTSDHARTIQPGQQDRTISRVFHQSSPSKMFQSEKQRGAAHINGRRQARRRYLEGSAGGGIEASRSPTIELRYGSEGDRRSQSVIAPHWLDFRYRRSSFRSLTSFQRSVRSEFAFPSVEERTRIHGFVVDAQFVAFWTVSSSSSARRISVPLERQLARSVTSKPDSSRFGIVGFRKASSVISSVSKRNAGDDDLRYEGLFSSRTIRRRLLSVRTSAERNVPGRLKPVT